MRTEQAYRAPDEIRSRRPLRTKWFVAVVVIGFLCWLFVGTMYLIPIWIWAVVVALLVLTAAAIVIFGPHKKRSDRE